MEFSVKQLAAPHPDGLGRYAANYGHGRNITRYDSSCRHDRTPTNSHTRHDDCSVTNPGIIADGDGAGFITMIIIVGIMPKCPDYSFLGDVHIVADGKGTATTVEQDATVDYAMVPHLDLVGSPELACKEHGASLAHPEPSYTKEKPAEGVAWYITEPSVAEIFPQAN
jgi:hypothetical protein